MSYSLDANLLLYASNSGDPKHKAAADFLKNRTRDMDLMCLTWPVLMAYQRIATHPSIFKQPLTPSAAWSNIRKLIALPRVRVITEEPDFASAYAVLNQDPSIRGNLVADAHIATILQQHGVRRLYTADSDFRKFDFLEVINPL